LKEKYTLCKRGCCVELTKMKDGVLMVKTNTHKGIFLTWGELEELKRLIKEGKI